MNEGVEIIGSFFQNEFSLDEMEIDGKKCFQGEICLSFVRFFVLEYNIGFIYSYDEGFVSVRVTDTKRKDIRMLQKWRKIMDQTRHIKKKKRRIVCLLLALGLTLDSLAAGGAARVQAADNTQKEQAEDTQKEQTEDTQKEQISETEDAKAPDSTIYLPKAGKDETVNFRTMRLNVTRKDDTSFRITWREVSGADGYELYGARCNTQAESYRAALIATLGSPDMTAWVCRNLKPDTYYKFAVRAYKIEDGKKEYLVRSQYAHAATGGGKYGIIAALLVNKDKVTLSAGKTFQLLTYPYKGEEKTREHAQVRFESTKPSVADVSDEGVITAKKAGTCTVFVYTQNGFYQKVKVTVK